MTTIDTGTIALDAQMLADLTAAGVSDHDARELARVDAFGGAGGPWVAGLRAVARLMNKEALALDWGQLPPPWGALGERMTADDADSQDELLAALGPYDEPVRLALLSALAATAQRLADQATAPNRANPRRRPGARTLEFVETSAQYLRPIDAELLRLVQHILVAGDGKVDQRRKEAGEQVIEWLAIHGRLIRTPGGRAYYLHRDARRLYALDSDAWTSFLYLLTGVNPAATTFRYLLADCMAAAGDGEQLNVLRVAHWDAGEQMLRVSRFDGTVYRLDGLTIATEANGDGPVVFEDSPVWAPYAPDLDADSEALDWALSLPHWAGMAADAPALRQLYRTWWLATFFSEANPTKPILVLKGEKGSGKTMALRVMLQLLFGPLADVSGVPDKPDAFAAMASNTHISALDNMDNVNNELRDKIAALATGKHDQVRELYTTNEVRHITYRSWLAVTSRTPDTLQRDDLADRLLLLPVERLSAAQRVRESLFLQQVAEKRNLFWGGLLNALNAIVANIRAEGIPERGGLRMEDWAAFGTSVARAEECEDTWNRGVAMALQQQSDFLLEDNIVAQAIEAWLDSSSYSPSWKPTRVLYQQSQGVLFGMGRPDANWPRSAKGFTRQLTNCRDELRAYFGDRDIQMEWRQGRGNAWEFIFLKKVP